MSEFIIDVTKVKPRFAMSPGITGEDLIDPAILGDKVSIGKISLQPGCAFEGHTHTSEHLIFVLEGAGFLSIREDEEWEKKPFKQGDLVAVPGLLPHAVSAGEEGAELLVVAVPVTLIDDPHRATYVD